ncbi:MULTISPECIES: hypothetical protein [Thermus]|jgi:hypothetical protein|uniref:Uncharacterized protein n=1 Tax=Thermus brockianus TaxID=56956 RepID=A0A1J0LUZ5_THEBO|nr:hypothetical protein [Thermus brockianus]APD09459.1 hypothetical protein A0O31_01329 [Thermus brockianus]
MRTVKELRLAGLFAYLAALVLGLLLSYFLHVLLGGGGRLGWGSFNLAGLLEGLGFVLAFTFALYLAKKAVRVPCTTLLTAGLLGPAPARRLARPLPRVEGLEAYEGRGVALLVQEGRPVGVLGLADHILPLEEVAGVEGEVAVSELAPLFLRQPLVLVFRGEEVLGAIPREAFFRHMGFGA